MKNNDIFSRIPRHYWGYLSLIFWLIAGLVVLRHDPYGLTEGAAKSILLSWSVADRVASSVVTFGTPDMRTLLYLPTGFLWTGHIFPVKVLTLLLLAVAARVMFSLREDASSSESALIATGLLLIAPLTLSQLDSLATGTYLLIGFAFGAWVDRAYRASPKSFGGWFFAQLIICAFTVSLHPAGIAYPAALLWSWRTEPLDTKQQKFFLIGVSFATLLILIIRMGWAGQTWLHNPLHSLGAIFVPESPLSNHTTLLALLAGIVILALLLVTIFKQYKALRSQLIGRIFLIASLLGAFVGDQAWALIALATILYFGFPLLLRNKRSPTSNDGFMKQRGWIFFILVVISTLFMQADKLHYAIKTRGMLSAQDKLIKTLAIEARESRKVAENTDRKVERFRVASQWPSRTMIACKCDTLPLPPASDNPAEQLKMLKGISYLLLDPKETDNLALTHNLSLLGTIVETVSLQRGGVLLHVAHNKAKAAPQPPHTQH